jgi:lipid A ethanolaminephosphotransferase
LQARWTIRPELAALSLAAYFTLVLNGAFWRRLFSVVAPATPYDWLFVAAVGLVLFLLLSLMFGLFTLPYVMKPVAIALLLASSACTYFMSEYGVVIDSGMLTNILETDRHEAADLTSLKFVKHVALFGGVPALLVALTALHLRSPLAEIGRRLASGLAIGVLVIALIYAFLMNFTSVFRQHEALRHELVPFNYIGALHKVVRGHSAAVIARPLAPYGIDAARGSSWESRQGKSLTVLVIGETARAENLALNGYARPTNPKLSKLPDLISFSDVRSCGTATAQSVPCMFSGVGRERSTTDIAHRQEGLLDLLKRSGFGLLWRDNQAGCKGVCSRVAVEVVAERETKAFYESAISYDDRLVDGLAERAARLGDHAVIVLHMIGSHGPAYWNRYPPEFEVFAPACKETQFSRCSRDSIVNAYDNTLVYTDHVLARLIEVLKQREAEGVATSMLYVSDHGESLGERGVYLHGMPYAIAPSEQTHVPMLVWLSKRFEQSFAVSSDCLAGQRRRSLSHDNVFHSVLGLLDVTTRVYDRTLDLFAPCRTLTTGTLR